MSAAPWTSVRGDGTDALPPLMAVFEARLRNGEVWSGLAITRFCLKVDGGPFYHRGSALDPMEYRMTGADA